VARIPGLLEKHGDAYDPPGIGYFPWTRLILAQSFIALDRSGEAIPYLEAIITQDPESEYAQQAKQIVQKLRD